MSLGALPIIAIVFALVPLAFVFRDKLGITALYALIVAEALTMRYFFPIVPGFETSLTMIDSLSITAISAISMWFLLNAASLLLKKAALPIYDNIAPFLIAPLLVGWTHVVPDTGLGKLWPHALIAGFMLHIVDVGIVRPWIRFIRGK